ncbi:MAG TPA: ABC transporter permease [Thermoanaerobaculia bacterium]|jgi:lipopolysaccharide transport system permease protein
MSETVYTAHSELGRPARFLAEGARDLGRSLPVAWRLFLSNVQTRYRRSWLGALWLLLPTVGTTLVWVYLQGRGIVAIAPTGLPYPVYVLAGTILWQVFVDALNAPLQQLGAGRQMITRSRVPHEALIVAGALEVLLNCAVRLVVLAAMLLVLHVPMQATLLLVPFGIVALTLLGLTIGLLATPAGMLYDDVSRGIALVTTFWIFLTPVLYATPRWGILRFNPVTPLLDTTRAWLTAGPATDGFATVMALTIPALVLAWLFNRLARPHVVARLG